jgi:hypothetical protein
MNKYIEIYQKNVKRILWPEELAFNQTHKVQASERSKPSKITLDVASVWQGPHEQQVWASAARSMATWCTLKAKRRQIELLEAPAPLRQGQLV